MKPLLKPLLFLTVLSSVAHAEQVPPAVVQQEALKQAFGEFNLGPKEKINFETEALPETSLFITNYSTTKEGTDVQIDKEKLKNFTRFSNTMATGLSHEVCLSVRAQSSCPACTGLSSAVNELVSQRLKKRGFTTKSGPVLSEDFSLSPERAFDETAARGAEKGCTNVAYVDLSPERTADEGEEEDEAQVRGRVFLQIKDPAGKKVKGRGQGVVHAPTKASENKTHLNGVATMLVSRLMADVYAQSAAGFSASAASKFGKEERYLRIEGMKSFASYVGFKQAFANALPEVRIEERVISPGVFEFAVASDHSLLEISQRIKGLNWSTGEQNQRLELVRSSADEITVVIK